VLQTKILIEDQFDGRSCSEGRKRVELSSYLAGIDHIYIFQITSWSVFFESAHEFTIGDKCRIWLPGLRWVSVIISRRSGNLFAAIFSEPIDSKIVREVRFSNWTNPKYSIRSVEMRRVFPARSTNSTFSLYLAIGFSFLFWLFVLVNFGGRV
jgi:hypothetical protein